MRYRIDYHHVLEFDPAISEHQMELRLLPRNDEHQNLLSFDITVNPKSNLFEHQDSFSNRVQSFNIIPSHNRLEIRLQALVENKLQNPFDHPFLSSTEERATIQKLLKEAPRHWDFLLPYGQTVPSLEGLSFPEKWPGYDADQSLLYSIQRAMEWINTKFEYKTGSTDVHCPLQEVLEKRSGVCQDFAHLLIALIRNWGFLARYTMGYQYLEPLPENSPATSHAWVEVYLPGIGWRGFDPTHALLTNHHYIAVAVGRDSQDAAPERGSFKGAENQHTTQIKLSISQQQ